MSYRELGELVGLSESVIESATLGRRPLTEENGVLFKLALGVKPECFFPGTNGRIEPCESYKSQWRCEHLGAEREDWTPTVEDFRSHRRYMEMFAGYKLLVAETLIELTLAAAAEADISPRCRQAMVWSKLVSAVHGLIRRYHLSQFVANAWRSPLLQKRADELANLRRKLLKQLDEETETRITELRRRFGIAPDSPLCTSRECAGKRHRQH